MKKILEFSNLSSDISTIKQKGPIVLVGGVFDILHKGHIEFLSKSKRLGKSLIVMLESDESVKKRKGENRPVNTQLQRAKTLSTLSCVDFILPIPFLKTDLEYYGLVKKLEPDIIAVTKSDPAYNKKVEQAKMVGGKVVEVIKRLPYSTTDLINKDNFFAQAKKG